MKTKFAYGKQKWYLKRQSTRCIIHAILNNQALCSAYMYYWHIGINSVSAKTWLNQSILDGEILIISWYINFKRVSPVLQEMFAFARPYSKLPCILRLTQLAQEFGACPVSAEWWSQAQNSGGKQNYEISLVHTSVPANTNAMRIWCHNSVFAAIFARELSTTELNCCELFVADLWRQHLYRICIRRKYESGFRLQVVRDPVSGALPPWLDSYPLTSAIVSLFLNLENLSV